MSNMCGTYINLSIPSSIVKLHCLIFGKRTNSLSRNFSDKQLIYAA
jgi:hypothetical protein